MDTPQVCLGEILGVLSLVGDLGMGQPMEHALVQTMVARRLGERVGLSADDGRSLSCGSLLAWVGCHVDAYEQAKWFGDEARAKAAYGRVDLKSVRADLGVTLRNLGAGQPLAERVRALRAFLGDLSYADHILETHSFAIDTLAVSLGMDDEVRKVIRQNFERWDGRGPHGERADAVGLPSRVVNLSDVAVAFYRSGGVDEAVSVARQRRGTQFDPDLVDTFCDNAPELFEGLPADDGWAALMEAEPSLRRPLDEAELDAALEAIADFIDVKSPYTLGHSRAVGDLAGEASAALGLPDPVEVRRAGLLHDLGRLGVSNSVWDKQGSLTPAETERVRMHPYLTERALTFAPGLARLGSLAVLHHERMDGSGYPRGMSAAAIPPGGRVLAAADAYRAKLEPRPHRAALTAEEGAAFLQDEVRAGRLDGDVVAAVLKAAGHRVRRPRNSAGLTPRELEVLALLARGLSQREIAGRLWITRKTTSNHVEHIYTKLGVNNRALASLEAARLGLVG